MKVYRKEDSSTEPEKNVKTNGVQPEILVAIMLVSTVYQDEGYGFVLTDLVSPRPGRRSLHPAGLAFDCRTWDVPRDALDDLVAKIRDALGDEYDVVPYETHIHIECDPD